MPNSVFAAPWDTKGMGQDFDVSAPSGPAAQPLGRDADTFGPLRRITMLDTAVASTNLGDQIIMEAVRHELADIVSGAVLFTVASHEWMGGHSRRLMRNSDFTIAGGTNLLSSRMWFRSNWRVTPVDALHCHNVVLMGVGWYQYQGAPDPYSRWLIRSLLSRTHLHGMRESYALKMLASIGITNTVNTGCPTIWALTPDRCARVPRLKAENVLTAVNSYAGLQDPAADRRMLETLQRHYRTVYLWIQTHTDYEYVQSLGANRIQFVNPSLASLDAILTSELDLDYVGNRLHAGIRSLQKGRRAIILEIDNRATEMGRDVGLPTVERTNFERLERMITEPLATSVRPPQQEIARWKQQFR